MKAVVYSWGFRKRTLSSIAGIKPGDERSVTLQPWSKAVESDQSLGTARVIDQLDNFAGDAVFWLDVDS